MANKDRVNFIWAERALTTIPPVPVSEVAYRDTAQTPEQMEVGQQYDAIYNSARHNQLLFLITSVAKTICENGIMPFLTGQAYSQWARCLFTDGKVYIAQRAIAANASPYPTPKDSTGIWKEDVGDQAFMIPPGAVMPFHNVAVQNRKPKFWGRTEYDDGWLVCDGGSDGLGGTVPDLRTKFIAGANDTSELGQTGGSVEAQPQVFIDPASQGGEVNAATQGGTISATTQGGSLSETRVTGHNSPSQIEMTCVANSTGCSVGDFVLTQERMPQHRHAPWGVTQVTPQQTCQNMSEGFVGNSLANAERGYVDLSVANSPLINNAGGSWGHGHPLNDPTHAHSMTNVAHNHIFAADAHTHNFTGASHTHKFTGVTHAHVFTPASHLHTAKASNLSILPPFYKLLYCVKLPPANKR